MAESLSCQLPVLGLPYYLAPFHSLTHKRDFLKTVNFGRAPSWCAVRTSLVRLINTQNGALRSPLPTRQLQPNPPKIIFRDDSNSFRPCDKLAILLKRHEDGQIELKTEGSLGPYIIIFSGAGFSGPRGRELRRLGSFFGFNARHTSTADLMRVMRQPI